MRVAIGRRYDEVSQHMSTILIHKSLHQEMMEDFEMQINELKIQSTRVLDEGGKMHIKRKIQELYDSIGELKKQIANPCRHAMLQQGVNPNEN